MCVQCHLCNPYNAIFGLDMRSSWWKEKGTHLALLHNWHCKWHCLVVNYARLGVSRPIYVNVDSPNLGFPYFNFLGLAHAVPWWNSDMIKLVKYCQKLIKGGIIGQKLPNVAKSYQMLPNVVKSSQTLAKDVARCCSRI